MKVIATKTVNIVRRKMKRKSAKIPYEMYTLPKSSERGQPFVDFNEVLKSIIPKKVKTVMKRRKKKNE